MVDGGKLDSKREAMHYGIFLFYGIIFIYFLFIISDKAVQRRHIWKWRKIRHENKSEGSDR